MSRLFLPTALFVGGVIGLVVCVFALLEGLNYIAQAAVALAFIALGFQELRFELGDVGEPE
jgi:hypothetical protein